MRILVITTCFSPKNVIGAVRLSKIVKYLVRYRHEVTVISPVLEDYDGYDMTLECDEFDKIRRVTIPYSRITALATGSYKSKNKINNNTAANPTNQNLKAVLLRRLRQYFVQWRDYEWSRKVIQFLSGDNQTYDLVISSYPNLSSHIAAQFATKKKIAEYWLADFRDPMVVESQIDSADKRTVKMQTSIVHNADFTSIVSGNVKNYFLCDEGSRSKLFVIPNGFDTDDFELLSYLPEIPKSGKDQLVFSYAGGLYGGERDCSPLFRAISELISEKSITPDNIRFDYAGRDEKLILDQAGKYGCRDIVSLKGVIPRAESIEMQACSDCVVVATTCYTDHGGAMTGKIYEPVMMKRPILLLVSGPGKKSEPGSFVNYLHAGTVYEESADNGDVSVIKQMILDMIREKKLNGIVNSRISESRRNEYSYDSIIQNLLKNINISEK